MANKKGLMVFGIGTALVGSLLLFRKRKPALPQLPPNGVLVALWNPPAEATTWQLGLCDWDITIPIHQVGGLAQLDITEPATFEVPSGVRFPLRIIALSISKWIDFYGTPALQHLYEMQSFLPYLWDWNLGDWGDEPDPTYREAFIPDYGSYYYNVAKERFEQ